MSSLKRKTFLALSDEFTTRLTTGLKDKKTLDSKSSQNHKYSIESPSTFVKPKTSLKLHDDDEKIDSEEEHEKFRVFDSIENKSKFDRDQSQIDDHVDVGLTELFFNSSLQQKEEDIGLLELTPEVFKAAGLRILLKGEKYTKSEEEQLCRYIIDHDVKVLKEKKRYEKSMERYLKEKINDSLYREVTDIPTLGANGRFDDVDRFTSYNRWKLTSKPYGEIAHQRYKEWRDNILEGAKHAVRKEQEQIKEVRTLWDDIRFNREENIKQRIASGFKRKQKEIKKFKSEKEIEEEEEAKRETRRNIIKEGNFKLLHKTKEELDPELTYFLNKKQWDKGIHTDFNLDNGFPAISNSNEPARSGIVKDNIKRLNRKENRKKVKITDGGMEKKYVDWLSSNNLEKVEKHVLALEKAESERVLLAQRRTSQLVLERRVSDLQNIKSKENIEKPLKSESNFAIRVENNMAKENEDENMFWRANTLVSETTGNVEQRNHSPFRVPALPLMAEPETSSKDSVVETPIKLIDNRSSQVGTSSPKRKTLKQSQNNSFVEDADMMQNISFDGPQKSSTRSSTRQLFSHLLNYFSSSNSRIKNYSTSQSSSMQPFGDPILAQPDNISVKELSPRTLFMSEKQINRIINQNGVFTPFTWVREYFLLDSGDRSLIHQRGDENRIKVILRENTTEQEKIDEEAFMELLLAKRRSVMNREAQYKDFVELVTRKYSNRVIYHADDLIQACRDGDYIQVIRVLDHHNKTAGPNDCNEDGESALFATLTMIMANESYRLYYNIKELSLLSIMSNSTLRNSSLRNHIFSNMEVIILLLLHKGGDLDLVTLNNDPTKDNYAVMHLAAASNDLTMLSWLCSRGANVHVLSHPLKRTPLSLAVERDQIPAALFLIRSGAITTINQQDSDGRTALHLAASYSSLKMAKILLICGADPTIKNNAGLLPYEEALRRGRDNMFDMINKFVPDSRPHQTRMNFLDSIYGESYPKNLLTPKANAN